MKNITLATGILILGSLIGCAPVTNVETFTRPGIDYMAYHTFTISHDAGAGTATPKVVRQIQGWVADQLQEMGFVLSDNREVSFMVVIHAGLRKQIDLSKYDFAYAGNWDDPPIYTEGTLVIDMYDPDTRQLIWRGSSTEVMADNGTGESGVAPEKLKEVIARILAGYPTS